MSHSKKQVKRSSDPNNVVSQLPESVILRIFSFLEVSDLVNVATAWKGVKSLPQYASSVRDAVEKGISGRKRGHVWKLLSRSSEHQLSARNGVKYEDLVKEDTEFSEQIRKDICRTFPENVLIQDPTMQERLYQVLCAYAVYFREVGYCQGMSPIVALLCVHMSDEDAFWTLVRLARKYKLASIWKPGLPGLLCSFYVLERLERKLVPGVYKNLKKKRIMTSMYATTWFVTVYLYNLSFVNAMRLWDIFLYEGFSFLYAVAIAFLQLHQDQIADMDFEDTVRFLQFNSSSNLDFEALLNEANSIKDKVKKMAKKYEARYKKCQSTNLFVPSPRVPAHKV